MRRLAWNIARWLSLGFAGMFIFGVGGEWFIHVADDKGWYKNAGKTWDRAMTGPVQFFEGASHFVTSLPFLMASALVLGLLIGLHLDRYLAKQEPGMHNLNDAISAFCNHASITIQAEQNRVEIALLAFNVGAVAAEIERISGHISLKGPGIGDAISLPTPVQRTTGVALEYPPGEEFMVILHQYLETSHKEALLAAIPQGAATFDLSSLNVELRSIPSGTTGPIQIVRHPNIKLAKEGEMLRNYTVFLSVNETLGAKDLPR